MPIYDSQEECAYRLNGTYVLYKGQPVYVCMSLKHNSKFGLKLATLPYDLKEKEFGPIYLDDPALIYTGFPLGYINTRIGAVYLQRFAKRFRQQGVNHSNIKIYMDENISGSVKGNFNWERDVLRTAALNEMVSQTYPMIGEALQVSRHRLEEKGEVINVAIHRKLAVNVDAFESKNLFYMCLPIARCHKDGIFKIPAKFTYLKEHLTELKVPVQ